MVLLTPVMTKRPICPTLQYRTALSPIRLPQTCPMRSGIVELGSIRWFGTLHPKMFHSSFLLNRLDWFTPLVRDSRSYVGSLRCNGTLKHPGSHVTSGTLLHKGSRGTGGTHICEGSHVTSGTLLHEGSHNCNDALEQYGSHVSSSSLLREGSHWSFWHAQSRRLHELSVAVTSLGSIAFSVMSRIISTAYFYCLVWKCFNPLDRCAQFGWFVSPVWYAP